MAKRIIFFLTFFIAVAFLLPKAVLSTDFSSSSFKVRDSILNINSATSSSSSFRLFSSMGQLGIATSTSSTFGVRGGFLYFPFVTTPVVSTTTGDSKVDLSWTAATAGLGFSVSGYSVGSSTVSGGPYTNTNVGNVLSSSRTGLTNGTTYYFIVRVLDAFNNSIATSTQVSGTPTATSLTFTVNVPSVNIGSFTPNSPVSSSTVLTVNTTNSTGYNISVNRASTTPTLFVLGDNATTTVPDTPNGNNWTAPVATSTAGPSAVWNNGTTKSLGFRLKLTGTVANAYSSTWWGTDDTLANAKYSGISTSTAAQKIADTTLGSGTNENTTVEYRIDVSINQKSGVYTSSPVTYTALVNP